MPNNIGEVKEYKIKIAGKEYTFRLDFKALLKFQDKYDKTLDIFNDFLHGKNQYACIIKILSCACAEKEFTEEELQNGLGFNYPTMHILDEITTYMIDGSFSVEGEEVKNSEASQNQVEK